MSHWESVPFDILQLELSYLNLEDRKVIDALCGDPILNSRLQCSDPNGFLWRYLYTHKLSHILPTSGPSLKERYYEFLRETRSDYPDIALLQSAARMGYEILAENLLKRSIDIEPRELNYVFLDAVRHGKLPIIELLVKNGYIRSQLVNNVALESAIKFKRLNVVEYLLDHGDFTPHMLDKTLIFASRIGQLLSVELLLKRGANIHTDHDAALRSAVIDGHLNVVRYLLDHGANINSLTSYTLNEAARNGHSDVVDYITSLLRKQNQI